LINQRKAIYTENKRKNTLSVQLNEIEELRSFVLPKPIGLEVGLLKKTQLPSKEGGVAPIKDEIISLFPNLLQLLLTNINTSHFVLKYFGALILNCC
jgi:hypothetical protein